MLKMYVVHTYPAAFPLPVATPPWLGYICAGRQQQRAAPRQCCSQSCQPCSSTHSLNVGFHLCCSFHLQSLHQQHTDNYLHYIENLV